MHTPGKGVRYKRCDVCLDTHIHHHGRLENGKATILETRRSRDSGITAVFHKFLFVISMCIERHKCSQCAQMFSMRVGRGNTQFCARAICLLFWLTKRRTHRGQRVGPPNYSLWRRETQESNLYEQIRMVLSFKTPGSGLARRLCAEWRSIR